MVMGVARLGTCEPGKGRRGDEILVDEGDTEGLTEALKRLLNDRGLSEDLGARNLEIVKARYSERNISTLRDLFLQTPAG